MRITSKGQVTIPIEVRQKAGLLPDTEVEFVVRGKTVIVKKSGENPSSRSPPINDHARQGHQTPRHQ